MRRRGLAVPVALFGFLVDTMKFRIRIASVVLILAATSLNGVSVACSALCSMYGPTAGCAACLSELQGCGAHDDPPCCEPLRCKYDMETDRHRCVVDRG